MAIHDDDDDPHVIIIIIIIFELGSRDRTTQLQFQVQM
jgi:hypothetical protein